MSGCQGLRKEGRRSDCLVLNGYKVSVGSGENTLKLDRGDGSTTLSTCWNCWTVHFKMVTLVVWISPEDAQKYNESNFQKLLNFLGLKFTLTLMTIASILLEVHLLFSYELRTSALLKYFDHSWTLPYYRITCYHYRGPSQCTQSYYQDTAFYQHLKKNK